MAPINGSPMDPKTERNLWMSSQKKKGIKFRVGTMSDLTQECQNLNCYVLIYKEISRVEKLKKFINNLNYFHRILSAAKESGNKTTEFFIFETKENVKPAIISFRNKEKISENVLGELIKHHFDVDETTTLDKGIASLKQEFKGKGVNSEKKHPSADNLEDWMDIFEDNGALNLGELDPSKKLGDSFVLIIDNNSHQLQKEEEKIQYLEAFLKCSQGNQSCLIFEIPGRKNLQILLQEYQNNVCISKDMLVNFKTSSVGAEAAKEEKSIGEEVRKPMDGSVDVDILSWIEKMVEKGVDHFDDLEGSNIKFGDRFVLSLEINPDGNEQSSDLKKANLDLFEKCLKVVGKGDPDSCIIVEASDFKSKTIPKQKFSILQYRANKCICKDLLKKRMKLSNISSAVPNKDIEPPKGVTLTTSNDTTKFTDISTIEVEDEEFNQSIEEKKDLERNSITKRRFKPVVGKSTTNQEESDDVDKSIQENKPLTKRRYKPSERKSLDPLEMLHIRIRGLEGKGAVYKKDIDDNIEYGNSCVLLLSRKDFTDEQTMETKLETVTLFEEELENHSSNEYLIVETYNYERAPGKEKHITVREYKRGKCFSNDLLVARKVLQRVITQRPSQTGTVTKKTLNVNELSFSADTFDSLVDGVGSSNKDRYEEEKSFNGKKISEEKFVSNIKKGFETQANENFNSNYSQSSRPKTNNTREKAIELNPSSQEAEDAKSKENSFAETNHLKQNNENDLPTNENSFKTRFEKKGAKLFTYFEKMVNSIKDGVLLYIERSYIPQSDQDKETSLKKFEEMLDENIKNQSSREFWMVEICYSTSSPLYTLPTCVTIQQYQNNLVISDDLLAKSDRGTEVNFASCCKIFEDVSYKPQKKTLMKVPCPCKLMGLKRNINWFCSSCKKAIYYGFDKYFYCNCGRSVVSNYWFKCNEPSHGMFYSTYENTMQINSILSSLQPSRNLNILLLGESGVGKSTLINAFANYSSYKTLQEANSSELKVVIPASFVVTNHLYNEQRIEFGSSKTESFGGGGSSTQTCQCYRFNYGNHDVILIDTPGIGDTRGSNQDSKNFEEILSFIANFESIDGICILLKPNESRLSIVFRYCVEGLLSQLHKSASKNIAFIFTNARSTFYRPGESLPQLRQLLKRIKDNPPYVDIPLSQETIYCFDNESFRFLVAFKQNVKFAKEDEKNFSISWDRSVAELNRLFDYITRLKPHAVKDTVTINGARSMIINLAKPLCDITQNILNNVAALEAQKQEIRNAGDDIQKLKKSLNIPIFDLEIAETSMPRTVCTSDSCVGILKNGTTDMIDYKTVCHRPCHLTGVKPDVTNNTEILQCWAILADKTCRKCKCRWEKHMHIKYDTKIVGRTKFDDKIQSQMNSKEQRKRAVNETIDELEEKAQKHKQEKDIITQACATFATFLNNNAITPYNDAVHEYLDYMIKTEETLAVHNPNRKSVIDELRKSQESYLKEKAILDDLLKNEKYSGSSNKEIKPEDITETIQKLKSLELNGSTFQKMLQTLDKTQAQTHQALTNQTPNISYVKATMNSLAKGVRNYWEKKMT